MIVTFTGVLYALPVRWRWLHPAVTHPVQTGKKTFIEEPGFTGRSTWDCELYPVYVGIFFNIVSKIAACAIFYEDSSNLATKAQAMAQHIFVDIVIPMK